MQKIKRFLDKSLTFISSRELFALAVVLFLIDHAGLYFDTDNTWWRIFRACAFVWFVPAGYNAGGGSPRTIIMGMAALLFLDQHFGFGVFPLNALATILIIKYGVDYVMTIALRSKGIFWATSIAMVLAYPATNHITEYGSMAMLMGMAGWLLRNQHEDKVREIVDVRVFLTFNTISYLVVEQVTFRFSGSQLAFVILSTAWMAGTIYHYRRLIINSLRNKPCDAISRFCDLLAHKSMEVYVGSYMILKFWIVYTLGNP